MTSYALLMNAGASADLVSLGTDPKARAGLASRLLTSALQDLAGEGVEVILEVAVDNIVALALYKRSGFIEAARRAGYYLRSNGCRCDRDAPKSRAGFGLTRTGARHRNRPQRISNKRTAIVTKKLFIKTYGCQMNVDSDRMTDVLAPLGYTATGSAEGADMVI